VATRTVDFIVNSRARVKAVYKDPDGVEYDPGSGKVTFKHRNPAGDSTTYTYPTDSEIVQDSTGNYHVDLLLDDEGFWVVQFNNLKSGNEERVELVLNVTLPGIP